MTRSSVAGCSSAADGAFLSVSDGATAEVAGAQFRALASEGAGGAVLVRDASLHVRASEFRGCSAVQGGGAIAAAGRGDLQLQDCVFEGCVSEREGGCVLSVQRATTIEGCAFQGARSKAGGGALSTLGTLRVERTTFEGCCLLYTSDAADDM
eukprot:2667355-Rhodomonas_salina.1